MAKRKHDEQELPFVALMDTMTNVVGVLIIVWSTGSASASPTWLKQCSRTSHRSRRDELVLIGRGEDVAQIAHA